MPTLIFLSKLIELFQLFQLFKKIVFTVLICISHVSQYGDSPDAYNNDILQALKDKITFALALLDLTSVFDTLDHSILFEGLHSRFNTRGSAL